MGVPNRQIGWSQESNLLWYILSQLKRLTSIVFSLKEAATPKYKVYTALLTQSGGDDSFLITTPEPLVIGRTYQIAQYQEGDDFTNVGAPSNESYVWFVATGTTPSVWTNGSELFTNVGAPVVTVLENTIGNIWFTFDTDGVYYINSNGLFIENKTVNTLDQTVNISGNSDVLYSAYVFRESIDNLRITIYDSSLLTFMNDALINKLIEIRVYN